jgi:hypothetical protein
MMHSGRQDPQTTVPYTVQVFIYRHQSKLGKNCRWGLCSGVRGIWSYKGRESMQSNMMPAASGVS